MKPSRNTILGLGFCLLFVMYSCLVIIGVVKNNSRKPDTSSWKFAQEGLGVLFSGGQGNRNNYNEYIEEDFSRYSTKYVRDNWSKYLQDILDWAKEDARFEKKKREQMIREFPEMKKELDNDEKELQKAKLEDKDFPFSDGRSIIRELIRAGDGPDPTDGIFNEIQWVNFGSMRTIGKITLQFTNPPTLYSKFGKQLIEKKTIYISLYYYYSDLDWHRLALTSITIRYFDPIKQKELWCFPRLSP